MNEVFEELQLKNQAPNMASYIKRFREHPLIESHQIDALISENYWIRSKEHYAEAAKKPLTDI